MGSAMNILANIAVYGVFCKVSNSVWQISEPQTLCPPSKRPARGFCES